MVGGRAAWSNISVERQERSLQFIPRLPIIFPKDRKEPASREDTCQPAWYEGPEVLGSFVPLVPQHIPVAAVTAKNKNKKSTRETWR